MPKAIYSILEGSQNQIFEVLFCMFDKNEMKQGCYIPGLNIEILDPKHINEIKPDYIIILPWNLKKEIKKDLSFISNWGGKLISFE